MTILSVVKKSGPYVGDGVNKVFPITFSLFDATDIKVISTVIVGIIATDTELIYNVHYSAVANVDQSASPGGTVTLVTAPLSGVKITILRNVELTQAASFENQGTFYPRVIENALDKLTMEMLQLQEQIDRAYKYSVTLDQLATTIIYNLKVVSPEDFGAVGDAITDDRAAIQSAINYAETFSTNNSLPCGHVFVDLGGKTYAIGAPLLLDTNVQGLVVQNGGITALNTASWTASNAAFVCSSGRWPHLRMLIMDLSTYANGIYMTGGVQQLAVENVKIYRYNTFGLKADGGFQLRLHRSHFAQWRQADSSYTVQAERTGNNVWFIGKGDMEIVDCILDGAKYNILVDGGANIRIYDNHVFNGPGIEIGTPFNNPVNIKLNKGGNSSNIYISGNYIDNGKIETEITLDVSIINNEFYHHSERVTLDEYIRIIPTAVNQTLDRFNLSEINTYTEQGAGASPNICKLGTGGGFNFTANPDLQTIFHDMTFCSQTNGRAVVQTDDLIKSVLNLISSAGESLVRFNDTQTTGEVHCGSRSDDFIIKTGNVERFTVRNDGGIRIRNYYTKGDTTAANYTALVSDEGITFNVQNGAANVTYFLPNNTPAGWSIGVQRKGAGTLTLTANAGASLLGTVAGSKSVSAFGWCTIRCGRNIDGVSAEYYIQGQFT